MPSSSLAFRAPSLALLATEPLRALLEFCSSKLGQLAREDGDGHPVVVYPGLGAGAMTTGCLRSHLQQCAFAVHDWHRGVNTGPDCGFDDWLQPLRPYRASRRLVSAATAPARSRKSPAR